MGDRELAEFLMRIEIRPYVAVMESQLPDLEHTKMPTVVLHKETLARFRDSLRTLMAFSAQVCGVPVEKVSVIDMYKFLMERNEEESTNGK